MSVKSRVTVPPGSSLTGRLSRRGARIAKEACDDRSMADPRVERYAKLLVERCVDVQAGWQVLVIGMPLGRPLVDEVVRLVARRGAYALVRRGRAPEANEGVWTSEA